MNLFERFQRVAKAQLTQILNQIEDPEKVMNQAVVDLQGDLVKIRQSYAEVMATQKKMEKQKEAADTLVTEWLRRAQLALSKGDDDLAREALSRKQQAIDQSETLAKQIDVQTASLDKLYTTLSNILIYEIKFLSPL